MVTTLVIALVVLGVASVFFGYQAATLVAEIARQQNKSK